MYCPKCGQHQVSEELRFCSRCGFALSAVRELMAGGGAVVVRGDEAQANQPSRSQRGVRKGARMMLVSLALLLLVALLSLVNDGIAVLLMLTVLSFLVGFARVLYNIFFAEKRERRLEGSAAAARSEPATADKLGPAAARGPELPPARVAPADGVVPQRVETAEMSRPRSVTESTTRLLAEEADPRRGVME